jgi:hypothetical protein
MNIEKGGRKSGRWRTLIERSFDGLPTASAALIIGAMHH